ncbi:efflux RND transporter permease subunit [Leptospira biflexa]|uniref:Multidrug resistance protein, RND family, putative acriflavine resistance protein B putative membrane protein n=1 Tax=Leptospira biflexa serovar Patoc (strain Patoc 1 / ATCC 23582 / Paris) TaxID=456481 RepID=B0SRG1_LEPBP|nr:efflux RND transporter permease subunit [Leptospira biflexa]ABZ99453.1 Multidrug resistance protein, RND family, putative acriflavine resistance protein B; putative membrane protein [Leptospira biflexa serovar Patoc strain 'Patoc 1 (Paris)']
MFTKFLQRPVLAIVISVLVVFVGLISIKNIPVSQFPEIAPPRVTITLSFPGASAQVLVQSTITTLEQAINGVAGMRYMISSSTSSGDAIIQVLFEPGTNPNDALVQVKTRVDQMMYRVPELVRLEGIFVQPVQPSMLLYVNLYSKDPNASEKFLYNYATVFLLPELKRIHGIGQAKILGTRQYAMRVWLNPDRMRAYNVTTAEVMKAIENQSIIARPGRLGQSSGKQAQSLEYTLTYEGWFNEPGQYENIIIRAKNGGELLYLKDISKVELDSEFYNIYSDVDGHPAAAIMFKQTEGSNAKDVIEDIKAKLEELKQTFPPEMDYKLSYDVSNFIDAAIEKVIHTLIEAFVLVAIVVFIFLGDWRSTLIPIIAVPVSLIGAFSFMMALGLTINLITLFAMVLAIGIVVDDAIVVVEAVHAKMAEDHLSVYFSVKAVLGEISGAVIAITLLMTAVFVPVTFLPGPVGVFYRQFAITMATSIVLSGLVALTLTPVLTAMILKPHSHHKKARNPIDLFLEKFNFYFEIVTDRYVNLMKRFSGSKVFIVSLLLFFSLGFVLLSQFVPSGFVPGEDQGMIYAVIQTPPGSTIEKTNDVARKLQEIALKIEGVDSVASLAGYEILTEGEGSNAGTCLISLKDWSDRKNSVHDVLEELEHKTKNFGAIVEFFEPPAVPGFGAAGGVMFRLLDKTNSGDYTAFDKVHEEFMAELKKREELTGLFSFYSAKFPQLEVKLDRKLAMQKGVNIGEAMDNLDILVGSTYEQGFIRFNQFFKVYVQSSPEFRRLPSDILGLFTPNDKGEMVPYSSFMTLEQKQGANEITRYNAYTSSVINVLPSDGYTTGDVIKAIREVSKTLPKGFEVGWEGLSYDEASRGNEAIYIFIVVIVFVYLVLSAQYESFIIPFSVIFSLPPGIFGSFFLLRLLGLANDIYAQIGMIMLIGLLGKNAVLIVEFARQRQEAGLSVFDAALEGAKARFRPILMTSFAFIAGLIPLVVATGPGAIANHTIGACALGGMLFGTIFGVIVVPGLYIIFANIAKGKSLIYHEDHMPLSESDVSYQNSEIERKKNRKTRKEIK